MMDIGAFCMVYCARALLFSCELTGHSEMKRKASFPFAFHSFFRNFGRIRRISLYKGDAED